MDYSSIEVSATKYAGERLSPSLPEAGEIQRNESFPMIYEYSVNVLSPFESSKAIVVIEPNLSILFIFSFVIWDSLWRI